MKPLLLLILGLCPILAAAQTNFGPRITALGNTGVVIQDAWSLQANQAGLVGIKGPVFSGSFESKYFNPELSTKSAIFAIPFKRDVFGLSFQTYGFSAYTEQRIGFAYAKMFGKTVSTALNVNYHSVKIPNYSHSAAFSVEAGLQFKASDKLSIGAHITNPNRSTYNYQVDAVIPVSTELGLAYAFTSTTTINTAIVKTLNSPADLRCGLEYEPAAWLALRGGFSSNPFRQYAGFGTTFQKIGLDVAASFHPILGYSPQVALSYEF
jgi:hypothetical protein